MTKPNEEIATRPPANPLPVGSQQQFDRYLPVAALIPESEIEILRGDVSLVLVNAQTGADAVLARIDEVREALPKVSVPAIENITDLGLALAFAAGQIERYAAPASDVRAMISRASQLRTLLLGTADMLALAGVLPAPTVKKIREGRGSIDTAGDCVALAALYQENAAAVHGKVPFTTAEVAEAADVGSRLLAVLRPEAAARKPATKEVLDAATARNQLWTLFERTWENEIWRSGAWLFGRDVDEHVPPLLSRVVGKRASKDAPSDPGFVEE